MKAIAVVAIALAAPACSDDCGIEGAPEFGLTASGDQVALTYGDLSAIAGNDCSDPATPSIISLTISGKQMGSTDTQLTICVPRPDQLENGPLDLGAAIVFNQLDGSDASCTYSLEPTVPPTGTLRSQHMCSNGTDKAGFALVVNGAVTLARACGGTNSKVAVTLTGTTAVARGS